MSDFSAILCSSAQPDRLMLSGELTIKASEAAQADILQILDHHDIQIVDLSEITSLDTSGAYVLHKTLLKQDITLIGLKPQYSEIMERVGNSLQLSEEIETRTQLNALQSLGQSTFSALINGRNFLSFFGHTATVGARLLIKPWRFRWAQIFDVVDNAGVKALGIIALLNFLIGIVIAYQGGIQLKTYGANIFIVEMVTITILRELAPLITAIIVAGRTGASITARVGSMKVSEELDAMKTLGMDPYEILYLPRIIGLTIALPLLTLFGDAAGIFGGMVISSSLLDVNFDEFIRRIPQTVPASGLIVGLIKAPVFAATIAMIACYQGQQVKNSAESVGEHTTRSVVQSIFLVILLDAIFSILFSWLDIPVIK
jgi:phospholipid/cholesterol/gamma-HCH transport system permease protein